MKEIKKGNIVYSISRYTEHTIIIKISCAGYEDDFITYPNSFSLLEIVEIN